MPDYLYEIDAEWAIPTELTMGPWSASAQHGGPPSALLTFLLEDLVHADEHLARIHVDLLSGIPLERLLCESSREQKSRRVAHLSASLSYEGRVVAQARALVLRPTGPDGPITADRLAAAPRPGERGQHQRLPDPAEVETIDAPAWWTPPEATPFHRYGVEHKFVSGAFDKPGAAVDWVRLRAQVVKGLEPTSTQRITAVADLGSGISAVFGPDDGVGMINADLNIAFVAPPTGAWFCLDSQTQIAEAGTGLAVTVVYDEAKNTIALATQGLLGRQTG